MTDRVEHATTPARRAHRRHPPADHPAENRPAESPAPRLGESVRTKPVRRSVDLSPMYHARLTEWCAEAAAEIGATRVTGQDVIRALVARLLVDQSLSRRIRADLSMYV